MVLLWWVGFWQQSQVSHKHNTLKIASTELNPMSDSATNKGFSLDQFYSNPLAYRILIKEGSDVQVSNSMLLASDSWSIKVLDKAWKLIAVLNTMNNYRVVILSQRDWYAVCDFYQYVSWKYYIKRYPDPVVISVSDIDKKSAWSISAIYEEKEREKISTIIEIEKLISMLSKQYSSDDNESYKSIYINLIEYYRSQAEILYSLWTKKVWNGSSETFMSFCTEHFNSYFAKILAPLLYFDESVDQYMSQIRTKLKAKWVSDQSISWLIGILNQKKEEFRRDPRLLEENLRISIEDSSASPVRKAFQIILNQFIDNLWSKGWAKRGLDERAEFSINTPCLIKRNPWSLDWGWSSEASSVWGQGLSWGSYHWLYNRLENPWFVNFSSSMSCIDSQLEVFSEVAKNKWELYFERFNKYKSVFYSEFVKTLSEIFWLWKDKNIEALNQYFFVKYRLPRENLFTNDDLMRLSSKVLYLEGARLFQRYVYELPQARKLPLSKSRTRLISDDLQFILTTRRKFIEGEEEDDEVVFENMSDEVIYELASRIWIGARGDNLLKTPLRDIAIDLIDKMNSNTELWSFADIIEDSMDNAVSRGIPQSIVRVFHCLNLRLYFSLLKAVNTKYSLLDYIKCYCYNNIKLYKIIPSDLVIINLKSAFEWAIALNYVIALRSYIGQGNFQNYLNFRSIWIEGEFTNEIGKWTSYFSWSWKKWSLELHRIAQWEIDEAVYKFPRLEELKWIFESLANKANLEVVQVIIILMMILITWSSWGDIYAFDKVSKRRWPYQLDEYDIMESQINPYNISESTTYVLWNIVELFDNRGFLSHKYSDKAHIFALLWYIFGAKWINDSISKYGVEKFISIGRKRIKSLIDATNLAQQTGSFNSCWLIRHLMR